MPESSSLFSASPWLRMRREGELGAAPRMENFTTCPNRARFAARAGQDLYRRVLGHLVRRAARVHAAPGRASHFCEELGQGAALRPVHLDIVVVYLAGLKRWRHELPLLAALDGHGAVEPDFGIGRNGHVNRCGVVDR